MRRSDDPRGTKRKYPPFWEKGIPILLGIIVVVIAILLIISVAVALGLFPGS